MSEQKQTIFAEGLYFQKRDKAPGFVIGGLSVKVIEFTKFLEQHQNNAGYVNVDIKQARSGKYYCELNQFKPSLPSSLPSSESVKVNEPDPIEYPTENINSEDIPF